MDAFLHFYHLFSQWERNLIDPALLSALYHDYWSKLTQKGIYYRVFIFSNWQLNAERNTHIITVNRLQYHQNLFIHLRHVCLQGLWVLVLFLLCQQKVYGLQEYCPEDANVNDVSKNYIAENTIALGYGTHNTCLC